MNHFMELSTSFQFKGIPLTFQGRLSDEKYISGRPTYFRLSYDALAKYKMRKAELEGEIGDLNTGIGSINQDIYAMEGKISYLDFLLQQYQLLKDKNKLKYPNGKLEKPELPAGKIPDINGKVPDTKIPDLSLPEKNKIDFDKLNLDSINQKMAAYKGTIEEWTAKKDSLQNLTPSWRRRRSSVGRQSRCRA